MNYADSAAPSASACTSAPRSSAMAAIASVAGQGRPYPRPVVSRESDYDAGEQMQRWRYLREKCYVEACPQ